MRLWNDSKSDTIELARAKREASIEIYATMMNRVYEGARLEGKGRIAEAIELYEKDIQDQFPDHNSYSRLHYLYTDRGRYGEAIQVCEAFLALPGNADNQEFREYLEKLRRLNS